MKILHILYSGLGGTYNVVENLVTIKHHNIINRILYIGPKLNKNLYIKKKNKKNYFFIKIKKFYGILYFFSILKIIKKEKPQVILLHNYQIIPCILAKLFFKIKFVYIDHQPLTTKSIKDYFSLILSIPFASHYVVLNKDNFKLINKFLINKNKISIIKNGIKIKKRPNKKNFKHFNIGMSARINDKKLHKLIIKTINKTTKKNRIKCFFAGDGEYKKKLKNYIYEHKIKNVIFDGQLNLVQLNNWYKKLDLYIQATKGEGSSISLLEAINNHVPVICSNVSGIKDMNLPNKKIILFKNNEEDLLKKILFFYSMSKKQKERIIMDQTKFLRKFHSVEDMLKKYLIVYKKIIKF